MKPSKDLNQNSSNLLPNTEYEETNDLYCKRPITFQIKPKHKFLADLSKY